MFVLIMGFDKQIFVYIYVFFLIFNCICKRVIAILNVASRPTGKALSSSLVSGFATISSILDRTSSEIVYKWQN